MKLNAAIPGESLTRELGNAPWEQPAQYDKIEDVLRFYLERFEDDEILENTLFVLDEGLPLELFIDSLLLTGEMEGLHSVDLSFLAGPVLHEYLLAMAEVAGVSVVEFQGADPGAEKGVREIEDFQSLLGEVLDEDVSDETYEQTMTMLEEGQEPEEPVEGQETMPAEEGKASASPAPSQGLMARR